MKYLKFRWCIPVVLLTTTLSLSMVFAEDNTLVGHSILSAVPQNSGAVKRAFPDPNGTGVKISSPGRTYGRLTAILVAAGGAAAVSLLLTRGGQKQQPNTPTAPVTTSVTAGAPVITAPPSH